MREIKFRAWDSDAECFTYSEKTEESHGEYVWGFEDGKVKAWVVVMKPATISEPEQPEAVELKPPQEYIGLKDKSGKEIYEGDIIQYQDRTFEVLWCNGGFKIMEMKPGYEGAVDGWIHEIIEGCHCGDTIDSLEIIGNIY